MIKIENFEIKNDGRCFKVDVETIQIDKETKEEKSIMKLVGYYPRFSDCIRAVRDKKLLDFVGGSETTRSLEDIEKMLKDFDNTVKKDFDKYVFVCEELIKKDKSCQKN